MNNSTITLTFGERVENHIGMQMIGKMNDHGLSYNDLKKAKKEFTSKGYICKIAHLNKLLPKEITTDDAYLLIVEKGVNAFCNSKDVFIEQKELDWDKKVFMYGKVCNKHARYNLCYDVNNQEPDYENKKGRIVSFDSIPLTYNIQKCLGNYFGDIAKNLKAEGNYYYDVNQCGIGFHGDSERKVVIACRLGSTMPICFQWYYKGERIGRMFTHDINEGDLYAMSEKTTGNDWKRKNKYTLRHSAGCSKFTK